MAEPYQLIPLREVHEDPDQPRRNIPDGSVAELAETLKSVGMIEPVVVRPDDKGYKLVVGHRRRRAAQIARLKEIPCVVRSDLTDLDVMRMQAIEDVQNEDLDPQDRFAFWARLWGAEKEANAKLSMSTFAKEILGLSPSYVRAGIDVAVKAPPELRAMLGKPEEGKLHPTYARYLISDSSLSDEETVAVGRKIADGMLPAAGGRIGTETLKVIRSAPAKLRRRLIHEPTFSLEEAKWELRHHERQEAAAKVKRDRSLTPDKLALKFIQATLDYHTKIDPRIAPFMPAGAWDEVETRLENLQNRIAEFLAAHESTPPEGEDLLDAIDAGALEALVAQDETPS